MMDWQAIIAYAAVFVAALLVIRAVVRAFRGKAKLPACPGCKHADSCETRDLGGEGK